MTNRMKWTVICGLLFGVFFARLIAQQMQSGGQAVTVTSGNITVSQSTASNLKVDLSGTAQNATAIKVDASATIQPVSGTVGVNTLPAGANLIGQVYPYTSCGTTKFTEALQAMPTSSTAITTTTTCVVLATISNTSAGALTVTLSDDQGTPVNFLNAVTLNAGETRNYPALGKLTSGIKVQASGSGITYALEGLQ